RLRVPGSEGAPDPTAGRRPARRDRSHRPRGRTRRGGPHRPRRHRPGPRHRPPRSDSMTAVVGTSPDRQPRRPVGTGRLVIPVTSAVGTGPTPVAAFDAALRAAGLADLNIIRLSSVIPTGAEVVLQIDEPLSLVGTTAGWGDRHYAVYADARAERPGEVAAACVGWVQNIDTGEGLFA